MATRDQLFTISDTSPASETTAIGSTIAGLHDYDWFEIDAVITGDAVGTIDVYLQRQVTTNLWVEWAHFTQVSATITKRFSLQPASTNQVYEVGAGTDSTAGTPVLAAGTFIGGHPGAKVRAVYVAGSGTTTGAQQIIYIRAHRANI